MTMSIYGSLKSHHRSAMMDRISHFFRHCPWSFEGRAVSAWIWSWPCCDPIENTRE